MSRQQALLPTGRLSGARRDHLTTCFHSLVACEWMRHGSTLTLSAPHAVVLSAVADVGRS